MNLWFWLQHIFCFWRNLWSSLQTACLDFKNLWLQSFAQRISSQFNLKQGLILFSLHITNLKQQKKRVNSTTFTHFKIKIV
jgi:hypothetical protein